MKMTVLIAVWQGKGTHPI